jgi:hypothetical protein
VSAGDDRLSCYTRIGVQVNVWSVRNCNVREITLQLPDEIEAALEAFQRDQCDGAALDTAAVAALHDVLALGGYLRPRRQVVVTPAAESSGFTTTSTDHDRVLARE